MSRAHPLCPPEEYKMKQDRVAGKVAFTDDPTFCLVDGLNFFLDATCILPACHEIGQLTLVEPLEEQRL